MDLLARSAAIPIKCLLLPKFQMSRICSKQVKQSIKVGPPISDSDAIPVPLSSDYFSDHIQFSCDILVSPSLFRSPMQKLQSRNSLFRPGNLLSRCKTMLESYKQQDYQLRQNFSIEQICVGTELSVSIIINLKKIAQAGIFLFSYSLQQCLRPLGYCAPLNNKLFWVVHSSGRHRIAFVKSIAQQQMGSILISILSTD